MSKYNTNLRTTDEEYNESYKYYQEYFNAQSIEARNLGALGDCICSIREAQIYLNEYSDVMVPALTTAIKRRVKNQKELAIKYCRELKGGNNNGKFN